MTKVRTSKLVVNTALLDSTDTNLTGILKGIAGKIAVATPDTDFATPSSVALKVSKALNLSDLADRQTALNNLGGAGAGKNSMVLTQDPADGNLKLMAASSGGSGGGLTYDFVLNENITAGNIVQLLSTGKIEKITSSVVAESLPNGTDYAFTNSATYNISMAYDPFNADKFVVCYKDNSDTYGKAVVGTISGTVVTFGTVCVFHSYSTGSTSVAFDSLTANRLLICFHDAYYNYYYTLAAALAGTVLTFGAKTLLQGSAVDTVSVVADPFTAGSFMAIARRNSDGYGMLTRIILGSGTAISSTTTVFFYSGSAYYPAIAADTRTPNRYVISYCNAAVGNYIYAVAVTVANTVLTIGTAVQVENTAVINTQVCQVYKSDNTFVVSYTDSGYSLIKASVLTIAGTTITVGAVQTVMTIGNQFMVMKSNKNMDGKILFVYYETTGGVKGAAFVATVAGTTITAGNKTTFKAGSNTYSFACDFDIQGNNPGKFTLVYYDYTAGYYKGKACVGQMYTVITNLSASKLLGVLKDSGTTDQAKPVILMGGIDHTRSGLTPNSLYYVQYDGSISTVNNPGSVLYGKAISTTAILTKSNF
jgi:hypothetical protein